MPEFMKVIVMEWIEGSKGPWKGPEGIEMVRIGLRCSTDQLLRTGLFHADPHRGNLLRTPKGDLAVIDFGMMVCFMNYLKFYEQAHFRYLWLFVLLSHLV